MNPNEAEWTAAHEMFYRAVSRAAAAWGPLDDDCLDEEAVLAAQKDAILYGSQLVVMRQHEAIEELTARVAELEGNPPPAVPHLRLVA